MKSSTRIGHFPKVFNLDQLLRSNSTGLFVSSSRCAYFLSSTPALSKKEKKKDIIPMLAYDQVWI